MMTIEAIAARLGAAVLLGALVGVEREVRHRRAGLRTHVMVSLAAAVYMIVSIELIDSHDFGGRGGRVALDPSRIASGVVMGLGFLGAGAISHSGGFARGLTTAAGLWMVAAVGLASGAGMYRLAGLATLLALLVLAGMRLVEGRGAWSVRRQLTLVIDDEDGTRLDAFVVAMRGRVKWLDTVDYGRQMTNGRTWLSGEIRVGNDDELRKFVAEVSRWPYVRRVTVRSTGG